MLHMMKKKRTIILFCIAVMLSLSACKQTEIEDASVIEQDAEIEESIAVEEEPEEEEPEVQEEEIEEEPEKEEEEELLTYVEENGLEYCDFSSVETSGMAMASDNHDDYIMTKVSFELSDIVVKDAEEEGYKTVEVTQEIKGYRWFDGKEYKTYVLFPSAVIADAYTGLIVPNVNLDGRNESTDEFAADIEWDGKTYHISYFEESKWEDGTTWEKSEDGYVWNCAAYVTLTITIPDDYDGLTLLLPPVLATTDELYSYQYIMDYYADEDFYLFKVDTTAEVEDETTDDSEKTTTDKVENSTTTKVEETKNQEVKQEETKVETTKQDSVKPAHSHSYTETVTANPTCSNTGSKTFTCSCGDNYTESIPANGQHNWVAQTEVIHHESMGHMESTPIEVNTFHCRGCGGSWTSLDEFRNHGCDHSLSIGGSFYYTTETTYDNTWVVDEEAWDETVTTYTCSTCGARQ